MALDTFLRRYDTNDNRTDDDPHTMMLAAQRKYAAARTMKAGVNHLLKCAKAINRPHSLYARGATEIIEICEKLLEAIERGDDISTLTELSFRLGTQWGQLRTRASI